MEDTKSRGEEIADFVAGIISWSIAVYCLVYTVNFWTAHNGLLPLPIWACGLFCTAVPPRFRYVIVWASIATWLVRWWLPV